MQPRPLIIGLDAPQHEPLTARIDGPVCVYETLPCILVRDGELFVESPSGFGVIPVSRVVFHGIFENDHDLISGLALWGGPCLPNARAMMDCRLKLPCLVRALNFTEFGAPSRGFVSESLEYSTDIERIAKWGNWHCGENKARFGNATVFDENSIVERFLDGDAVRVVVMGDKSWQIKLEGDNWLKSIHHPSAQFMDPDPRLIEDTLRVAEGFGLEIAANDYIITADGQPHLLEVNHIPNVTRFEPIWQAYSDYVVQWLSAE